MAMATKQQQQQTANSKRLQNAHRKHRLNASPLAGHIGTMGRDWVTRYAKLFTQTVRSRQISNLLCLDKYVLMNISLGKCI